MIMRGAAATQWFGGPVPMLPSGPRIKSGLGSVPWVLTDAVNSDMTSAAWQTIYRVPGRQFLNQCRTPQNPWGWVVGTGGNDYPTPMDITYTPEARAALQLDALLNNAQAVRNQGYACPTTDAELQQILAQSPFLNPQSVTGQAPTPLLPGFNPPNVVQPSPATQPTGSGSSTTAPGGATNQANGGMATPTGLLSTVQGYISDLTSGTDVIAGVPNWALLAGGLGAVILMINASSGRK